jgi:hypothetical protein
LFSSSEEVKCVPGWYNYDKDGLNPAGLFKVECDGNGGWSFLARNGKYLCVADGDQVKASGSTIGLSETFQIEILGQSLQAAIDAAGPGDTIQLGTGIYKETTVNIDKPITLNGAGAAGTVLDGTNSGRVITIGGTNPNVDVKLAGMVIRGGKDELGGGIYNVGRLTLEKVSLRDNTATYSGGGVYNYKGSLYIKDSNIVNNRAAHQGGGIINFEGMVDTVSTTIGSNTAAYGGCVLNHLGAVHMYGGEITNNKALGISSTEPLGEGGEVWNNDIFNNHDVNIHDNKPDDVYNQEVPTKTFLKSSTMPCCEYDNQSTGDHHELSRAS